MQCVNCKITLIIVHSLILLRQMCAYKEHILIILYTICTKSPRILRIFTTMNMLGICALKASILTWALPSVTFLTWLVTNNFQYWLRCWLFGHPLNLEYIFLDLEPMFIWTRSCNICKGHLPYIILKIGFFVWRIKASLLEGCHEI